MQSIICLCTRIEDIADIIDKKILIADDILEHSSDGELLLVNSLVSLLTVLADREHCSHSHNSYDNGNRAIAKTDKLAYKKSYKNGSESRADTARDALKRKNCISFLDVACHCRNDAEGWHVADCIRGIPDNISYGKPDKLDRFACRCGNNKDCNRCNRCSGAGNFQPRNIFLIALEFEFIENNAEKRIIDGIPHLNCKHNRRGFDGIYADKKKEGCKIACYHIINHILSEEICIIAFSLGLRCLPQRILRLRLFFAHKFLSFYNLPE